MNVAQLESDLRAAKQKIRDLVSTTTKACQEHVVKAATANEPAVLGRLMTTEERAALDAACAEAEGINTKILKAQGDADFLARLDKIAGGAATRAVATDPAPRPTGPMRSAGNLFAAEAAEFFKKGGHRASGTWRSPMVEVPYASMFATTLTEDPASGGKLVVPQYFPTIQQLMFKRLVVADLMASGTTDSNAIIYMVETLFTNAAAPVSEGGTKPESALAFDQKTDAVSKIAHWIPATEEILEDVPAMSSYIDARLRLGVQLAEEDQLLNGNGTPPNLTGIMNRPGLAPAVARDSAGTPPETNMDAIARQIAAIATTSFIYPDGIVMNPTNWFTVQTSKDANGQYFGAGPFAPMQAATMWGLPVAPTPSIVANTALVGAFGSMSQVFRKGGIRVEASNSHQDFFIKNLVAIRAEERLALAVYRPASFGKVTGLN
jgi:HK97 family phage major capsid protein